VTAALAIVLAYLLGSLPTGYLAGRMRGVDIRTLGSKNVGATNVFRTLGKGIGIAVMAVDIAKGAAAVLLAGAIAGEPWTILAAAAAMAGHVWPVWLGFKGGKGVATGAGAAAALTPIAFGILFVAWVAIVLGTRYVSVASILCAAAYAPLAWVFGASWPTIAFAGVASAAVIWLHRKNIRRLVQGTELRLSFRGAPRGETGG
jgi:glycerol-3-phosphate acyltransferase PlsY